MQFVNYFFASLISFSGLLIGIMLVKIAPEEQKPLEGKIFLARKIFLLSIFGFAIFYYYNNLIYLSILISFLIFLFFVEYKINNRLKKSMLAYLTLGIVFFISSKNINLFAITSSLIFLYGTATASLMYNKRQKNLLEIFLHNVIFIIAANALFLFSLAL